MTGDRSHHANRTQIVEPSYSSILYEIAAATAPPNLLNTKVDEDPSQLTPPTSIRRSLAKDKTLSPNSNNSNSRKNLNSNSNNNNKHDSKNNSFKNRFSLTRKKDNNNDNDQDNYINSNGLTSHNTENDILYQENNQQTTGGIASIFNWASSGVSKITQALHAVSVFSALIELLGNVSTDTDQPHLTLQYLLDKDTTKYIRINAPLKKNIPLDTSEKVALIELMEDTSEYFDKNYGSDMINQVVEIV